MGLRFNPVIVTDATSYNVKDYNSGVLHVIPNLTADITINLPAEKEGLEYEFWYGGAAADQQDWLITSGSDTNYFVGGVVHLTDGTPDIEAVYSDGDSNSKLTVLTPEAGTVIRLHCDGTKWYVNGQVVSGSAPSFANQA